MIFLKSRSRFEQNFTAVMSHPEIEFYQNSCNHKGITSHSIEGMLLYPLQTLAFGMPYFTFVDYIQISIQFGMKMCGEFNNGIQAICMKKYLWVPGEVDLQNINQFYCHFHGVEGVLGSLSCLNTIWKN